MAYSYGPGGGPIIPVNGVPTAGVNAVQTLTFGGTITGGSFRLAHARATPAINWTAVDATLLAAIDAAIEAVLGPGEIVASAGTLLNGIGTVLLTFSGPSFGRTPLPTLQVVDKLLTGTNPTLTIATTTPGVEATLRGAPRGTVCINVATGVQYRQTSANPLAPTWT